MANGQRTLSSIEQSIEDLRGDEQRLRTELEGANTNRSKLIEQRLDQFRSLAQVRTRNALSDGVINEADHLSHQVQALLKARQKSTANLKIQLSGAEKKYKQNLADYEKLVSEITALEKRLDKLAEQARTELADNNDYKNQQSLIEKASAIYERAKEKTGQAEQDRESKGKPYKQDPLFMYLWQRKYGAQSYKPNNLVRWLDGKVARLVRYHDARANYAVLLEIPVRLNEHLEMLGEDLAVKQDGLDDIEADKVRQLAGEDLVAELKKARLDQTKRHGELERTAAENSDIEAQLNRYAKGLDHPFLKAIELSAAFLEQKSLKSLMNLARQTPTPTDDELVDHIADIDASTDKIGKENTERRNQLETLFKRKEELIQLADNFRRARYDDPSSVFTPEDELGVFLEELVGGLITGAEYWSRAQSRHHWSSRPADPFRRQSSFPPFDFGSGGLGGGGFGGGGGGSFGSRPDFTTGGGF